MKKLAKKVIFLLLVLALATTGILPLNASASTVAESEKIINEILQYKLKSTETASVQDFIDKELSEKAGTSAEWYIIALCQKGNYNFSKYKSSVIKYLKNNKVQSASTRIKIALALIGTGSTDEYIQKTLDDSIGKQGIMSYAYGLHMLNNGYKSSSFTKQQVKSKLITMQKADGGWAVTGNYGDVDVTSMIISALAPFYQNDKSVKSAVNRGLDFLSSRQTENGGFKSYGLENAESSAQVITALSCLNIDCEKDSRFLKNGKSPIDALKDYKCPDGSFSHKLNEGSNDIATVQVLNSLVAYSRMKQGRGSLFIFDKRNPQGLEHYTEMSSSGALGDLGSKDENSVTVTGQTSDSKPHIQTTVQVSADDQAQSDDGQTTLTETTAQGELSTNTNMQNPESSENRKISYKLPVIAVIVLLLLVGIGVLFGTKKANKKNIIMLVVTALLLICFVALSNFKAVDEFYNDKDDAGSYGIVTVEVRCDVLSEEKDNKNITVDGVILNKTKVKINKGDSAYSALKNALTQNKIHFETNGTGASVYVEGINNIYEFQYGDLSGWLYYVNGEKPSVGCGVKTLNDGDLVQFIYTCDMGNDISIS